MDHGAARAGLLMVYTGNGKGKTTAAFGLGLRAWGHGQRVFLIQFMKGDESYGEVQAVRRALPGFTVVQSGLPTFVRKGVLTSRDLELAGQGLELARRILRAGEHELVILDEINVAIDYGLVPLQEVTDVCRDRPPHVTLVLTGRYAHPDILSLADTVSDVQEVKHHYRSGVAAQAGIEY